MKKRIAAVVIGIAVGGALWVGSVEAGPVGERQAQQHARIQQGVLSGELTPGEAAALRHEQRHIEWEKLRGWQDGTLTAGERARLHWMQERASAHIYHLKHNPRSR